MRISFITVILIPPSALAIFKPACDNNRIYERAAMCILCFFVKDDFSSRLNSDMSAATHIEPVFESMKTVIPRTQKKLLRSCPEVFNYILKKFANDQAISKMESAILQYTLPASTTSM